MVEAHLGATHKVRQCLHILTPGEDAARIVWTVAMTSLT